MSKIIKFLVLISFSLIVEARQASAYPLDGHDETKIPRLEGFYQAVLYTKSGKDNFLHSVGSLIGMSDVELKLIGEDFPAPQASSSLQQDLLNALGGNTKEYSISILDISDPKNPEFAGINQEHTFVPGSVGKIVVLLGVFQALADIYPSDVEPRVKVLKNTNILAGDFIITDDHEVPFWNKPEGRVFFRPLETGDRGNLWTFLDWMVSASSNAAASVVMRELVLLKHFGTRYPVSQDEAQSFIENSSPSQLGSILQQAITRGLSHNGLNPARLMQGSLFTKVGKQKISGSGGSIASTRELLKFLTLMEQAKLVDLFSSLEIKRLMLLTQQRIRYASSPALDTAAVYYKSGSLFKCMPEPGYVCKKFFGNLLNQLNSVAIIEEPVPASKYNYLVAVSSNVLRRDAAEEHARIATRIHEMIKRRHGGNHAK